MMRVAVGTTFVLPSALRGDALEKVAAVANRFKVALLEQLKGAALIRSA